MKAYELLEQKGWCQGNNAKDENGNPISTESPEATSFCLFGALKRCYPHTWVHEQYQLVHQALGNVPGVSSWNDDPSRTKLEVITLLKKLDI